LSVVIYRTHIIITFYTYLDVNSDPNTTLSIYTHVTDKMENDLMFKLEQYDKKLLESQKESLKVIKL